MLEHSDPRCYIDPCDPCNYERLIYEGGMHHKISERKLKETLHKNGISMKDPIIQELLFEAIDHPTITVCDLDLHAQSRKFHLQTLNSHLAICKPGSGLDCYKSGHWFWYLLRSFTYHIWWLIDVAIMPENKK